MHACACLVWSAAPWQCMGSFHPASQPHAWHHQADTAPCMQRCKMLDWTCFMWNDPAAGFWAYFTSANGGACLSNMWGCFITSYHILYFGSGRMIHIPCTDVLAHTVLTPSLPLTATGQYLHTDRYLYNGSTPVISARCW